MILGRKGKGNEGPSRQGGLVPSSRVHPLGVEAIIVHIDGSGFRDGHLHVAWHQPEMSMG